MKQLPLVAHRGFCAAYPENSLKSLRAALECGAAAVEFDVQLTRDHVAVVCHDDTLSRTAGVDVSILEHPFTELQSISVGEPKRFAQKFSDCMLPTLAQVVALLEQFPSSLVYVEIKIESIERFGAELVNKVVLEAIAPIASRCVIISDDLDALVQARAQSALPIGWIIHQWSDGDRQLASEAAPEYLVVNHKYFPDHGNPLWPGDWQWVVYETSKAEKAKALLKMGIEWVETNNICPMLEALAQESEDFPLAPIACVRN